VLIESSDGHDTWGTVGVSENLIEASWQALVDSITYKLKKEYGYKTQNQRGALLNLSSGQQLDFLARSFPRPDGGMAR